MKSENDFDRYADDYREIHTQNVSGISGENSDYFSEYKVKELRTIYKKVESMAFLDLGCGDGNTARYIQKYFPDFTYYGLDVSNESIQKAKEMKLDKCSFEKYDGHKIPFSDGTFDVVFLACVMHHVEKEEHVFLLREARRVIKKGGRIILFEHNPYNPLTQKIVKDCPFDEGVTLIPAKKMKDKLLKAGFAGKINIRYTIFFPRKGLFKRMLPLEKKLHWLPIGGQYYCMALN